MGWLGRVFGDTARKTAAEDPPAPAGSGQVYFATGFDLTVGARVHEGVPHPDWERVNDWFESLGESRHEEASGLTERAWVEWVATVFGGDYRVHDSADALLVSADSTREARATLAYLSTTIKRVRRALGELADGPVRKQIVFFLEEDDYYRYISGFDPEEGEFPMSAGMHIGSGCPHFVVHGRELGEIEPTIVHEMTHAFLTRFEIPLWLNEGMAVNMERQFTGVAEQLGVVEERQRKQRAFWTPQLIQEFWSGQAFRRTDDAMTLSYDLGRVLVHAMSMDWSAFRAFVQEARIEDAGRAAAERHLQLDLGEFVRHFLGRDDGEWGPLTP